MTTTHEEHANGVQLTLNAQPASIVDNAVMLQVEFRKFGIRKKVRGNRIGDPNSDAAVKTDADKEMLAVSKKIFASPAYEAICKFDTACRQWIAKNGSPGLVEGMSFFRTDRALEVDARVRTWYTQRQALVDAFMAEYESVAGEGERRLASLGNERDYPSPERVRGAFSMAHWWREFGPATKLQRVNPAVYAEEAAKFRDSIRSATEDAIVGIQQRMADVVGHLVERLSPATDGKVKIFRDSAVENVREFVAMLPQIDIMGDDKLAALGARITQLLDGVSAERLREQPEIRQQVASHFTAIKAQLDTMLTDRPKRRFDFDSAID
jgi:hypothetical protein